MLSGMGKAGQEPKKSLQARKLSPLRTNCNTHGPARVSNTKCPHLCSCIIPDDVPIMQVLPPVTRLM
jgi:hypothetical protein